MTFFFLGFAEERFNLKKVGFLALAGIFCGGAFLTKGFLAFAVPAVSILPFLVWEKRWKDIFILPWIPLFFVLITVMPWALLIHQREPDFWHYFIVIEHIERFRGTLETQHPQPFWFYLPILLGGAAPWIILAPCLINRKFKGVWSDWLRGSLVFRFALCWLIFPLLFYSACSGKLATYILPCYAPLAIIFATLLLASLRRAGVKVLNWELSILAIIFIVGGVGFASYQMLAHSVAAVPELFRGAEVLKWVAACLAAMSWAGFMLLAAWSKDARRKLFLFSVGILGVFFVANYAVPLKILESKAQGLFFHHFIDRVKPDTVIVVHPNVMHAAAWEFNRRDLLLYSNEGELEYGFKYPDAKGRLLNKEQLHEMIKKTPKGKLIYIMRGDFREGVPPAGFEVYDHEIMFSNF